METCLCGMNLHASLLLYQSVGGDTIKLLFSLLWWSIKELWNNKKQPQSVKIEVVFTIINIHKD